MVKLSGINTSVPYHAQAVLISSQNSDYSIYDLNNEEIELLNMLREAQKPVISLFKQNKFLIFQFLEPKAEPFKTLEAARVAGANLAAELKSHKITRVSVSSDSEDDKISLAYAEGLA